MGKNGKLLSLKIPSKIDKILAQYVCDRTHEDDFVFPEMKKANLKDAKDVFNKTKTATKKFNDNLKKLLKEMALKKRSQCILQDILLAT